MPTVGADVLNEVIRAGTQQFGLVVAAGTNAEALIEFLVAPTYVRLLLLDRPLDSDLLEESVRRTVAAFAVGL